MQRRFSLGSCDGSSNFNLNNLYAIIDKNNFQQTGSTKEIMNIRNLQKNGQVLDGIQHEVDGHNMNKLYDYLIRTAIK